MMKIVEKIVEKQNSNSTCPGVTVAFLGDSVTQGCFEIYKKTETQIETVFDKDTVLKGTLTCNWMMDCVTLDITDAKGEKVQTATAYVSRKTGQYRSFDMQEFVTVKPALIRGSVDVNALADGNCRCKVTVRLVTGEEITVRDFEFVK